MAASNDITGDQLRSRVSNEDYRLGYLRIFEKEKFKKEVKEYLLKEGVDGCDEQFLNEITPEEVAAIYDGYIGR